MEFVHRYVPPTGGDDTTLLLLHGTGGDENDLLPLGTALRAGAGMLSPRGKVLEHGMPPRPVYPRAVLFDLEDLARRTDELGAFVREAADVYKFDSSKLIAVGFSNGANIAASVILTHPGVLPRAVLLSPMVPFEPKAPVDLGATSVFIGAGRRDGITPPAQAERLAELLRSSGADVTLHWEPGGHAVTEPEVAAARAWLAQCLTSRARSGS